MRNSYRRVRNSVLTGSRWTEPGYQVERRLLSTNPACGVRSWGLPPVKRRVSRIPALNQNQGGMYIYVTMMTNCVAPVNLSHPYLEMTRLRQLTPAVYAFRLGFSLVAPVSLIAAVLFLVAEAESGVRGGPERATEFLHGGRREVFVAWFLITTRPESGDDGCGADDGCRYGEPCDPGQGCCATAVHGGFRPRPGLSMLARAKVRRPCVSNLAGSVSAQWKAQAVSRGSSARRSNSAGAVWLPVSVILTSQQRGRVAVVKATALCFAWYFRRLACIRPLRYRSRACRVAPARRCRGPGRRRRHRYGPDTALALTPWPVFL